MLYKIDAGKLADVLNQHRDHGVQVELRIFGDNGLFSIECSTCGGDVLFLADRTGDLTGCEYADLCPEYGAEVCAECGTDYDPMTDGACPVCGKLMCRSCADLYPHACRSCGGVEHEHPDHACFSGCGRTDVIGEREG